MTSGMNKVNSDLNASKGPEQKPEQSSELAPEQLPADRPGAVFLKQLELQRTDQVYLAGLCLTTTGADELRQHAQSFLHPHEWQRLQAYAHRKRADDYLRGRYAAKQATTVLCPRQPQPGIRVDSGIFRQPLLWCPDNPALEVSLSHAASVTAAIAYPGAHPMAIDTENIDGANVKTLHEQVTEQEQRLVAQLSGYSQLQLVTGLWTVKEALSKVMRCGLTAPISIFEIADCSDTDGVLEFRFKHFIQYKALCFVWLNTMCSIVLPANTRLVEQSRLAAGPAA